MQPISIPHKSYECLKNILQSFIEIKEVVLYGSRAKGNYNERSDIDLVIKNSNVDRHYLGRLKMEIDSSDIPYKVDIQLFEDIDNPDLIDHIQRVGKIIYKK